MRQWLKLFLKRGCMIAAQMTWIRLIQPLKKIMMLPSLMDLRVQEIQDADHFFGCIRTPKKV